MPLTSQLKSLVPRLLAVLGACAASLWAQTATAQTISEFTALNEPTAALCRGGTLEGSTETYVVIVEGEARTVLMRQLVNVEGEAEITFTKTEWDGIAALVPEGENFKDFTDCVERMTPLFLAKWNVQTGSVLERTWSLTLEDTVTVVSISAAPGRAPTILARTKADAWGGSFRASVRLDTSDREKPQLAVFDREVVAGETV